MWLAILVATHLLKNTWKMAYPKMMLNSLVISTFSKEWQPWLKINKTSFINLPIQYKYFGFASWNFFCHFLSFHRIKLRPWISVLRYIELEYISGLLSTNFLVASGTLLPAPTDLYSLWLRWGALYNTYVSYQLPGNRLLHYLQRHVVPVFSLKSVRNTYTAQVVEFFLSWITRSYITYGDHH